MSGGESPKEKNKEVSLSVCLCEESGCTAGEVMVCVVVIK